MIKIDKDNPYFALDEDLNRVYKHFYAACYERDVRKGASEDYMNSPNPDKKVIKSFQDSINELEKTISKALQFLTHNLHRTAFPEGNTVSENIDDKSVIYVKELLEKDFIVPVKKRNKNIKLMFDTLFHCSSYDETNRSQYRHYKDSRTGDDLPVNEVYYSIREYYPYLTISYIKDIIHKHT